MTTEAPASIAGRTASLDEAIGEAAAILSRGRNAVIAGLGTDIDGAREAIALAKAVGGAIDHVHGEAALRDLGVMCRSGWMVTTPLQARARADLVLLVGPGLTAAWPDLHARLALGAPPSLAPGSPRRVIHVCPGGDPGTELGVLRALIGGRPVRDDARTAALRGHGEALTAARFGVAVWSAASLDETAIEMLCGLIDDLNKTTRFSGLPLDPGGNAAGVMQTAAWRTGFPVRTGFGRGYADHDPWRFDAVRMVESGEADAALWVSAIDPIPPPWHRHVPLVALVALGTTFPIPPEVSIIVGRPGVDHDAVLFDRSLGTLAFMAASAPSGPPRTAALLARIAAAFSPPFPC